MESLKELTLFYCNGLTDAGMAMLATLTLTTLSVTSGSLTGAFLQSFVGSNISHTLESFTLTVIFGVPQIDDVHVATVLAFVSPLEVAERVYGT
jgi:hypothetical protein